MKLKKWENRVKISAFIIIAVCFFLVLLFSPQGAEAATLEQGDYVLQEGEVLNDDLYFLGDTLELYGKVEGDVVFFGRNLIIGGDIGGSLWGAGEKIEIDGIIKGSARIAGNTISLEGETGRDFLGAGNYLDIYGSVGKDFLGAGNRAVLQGPVERNVFGGFRTFSLDSTIKGDMQLEVERLIIGPQGIIQGDLWYKSPLEAEIDPGATIGGEITHREAEPHREPPHQLFSNFIRPLLSLILIAALGGWLFPGLFWKTTREIQDRPWSSLGYGFLILFFTPLLGLLLLITVIGLPLSFLIFVSYLALLYLSRILTGFYLGEFISIRLNRELNPVWKGIIGVFALFILIKIPYIGWLLHLLAVCLALGALGLYVATSRKTS